MSTDQSQKPDYAQKFFTWFIPILWGAALFLPAYSYGTTGFTCLTMGWGALLMGNFNAFLAWLANIPFFIAYSRYAWRRGSTKTTALIAGIAVFLSLFGLLLKNLEVNEGGSPHSVKPSWGVLLWFGSVVTLAAVCIHSYSKQQQELHQDEA